MADRYRRLTVALRRAALTAALLAAGCSTTRETPGSVDEIKLGMSSAEVRQIAKARGWHERSTAATAPLQILLLSSQPAVYVVFEDDKARLIHLDVFFRPHADRDVDVARCDEIFAGLRTRLERDYGAGVALPTADGERIVKWRPARGFVRAYELVDGKVCGVVNADIFDGGETELEPFRRRLGGVARDASTR